MNILLVGDYENDPRLGSAKVYHKLGAELRELGHRCDVLHAGDLGAHPRSARLRQAAAPVLAARAVARTFGQGISYDVIDAASAEGLWLAGLRRAGARGFRGAALVARSHGLEHLNYRRMLEDHRAGLMHKPISRRIWYPAVRLSQVAAAARLADRLIVLNLADAEFAAVRGWKPPDRIDVIPHGVSTAFLDDSPAAEARRHGILFCGSWTGVKGTATLIAAMTLMHDHGGAPGLTILGPGVPSEQVLADFPERVRHLVTVIPRVDEQQVMAHYRRHLMLVATSTYEGFGMVILEAMTQRLPVIATPVGCAPSLIDDGRTGLLVPVRDAVATAAAIRRLLTDDVQRRRIAEGAYRRVRAMTWRNTAAQTLTSYEKAIHRARSR